MSRRSTPERIYQANRAGTLRRLILEREPPERAEALVAAWEAATASQGVKRDWSPAWAWIADRSTSPA